MLVQISVQEQLWECIKSRYQQWVEQHKDKQGYTVNWEKLAVVNAKTGQILTEKFGKYTYYYSKVQRMLPKIELDIQKQPKIPTFSILGSIYDVLKPKPGEPNLIDEKLSYSKRPYLNPYQDFWQNIQISKKERKDCKIDVAKLDLYAMYCGFLHFEDFKNSFKKESPICYRAYFFSHLRYDVWSEGRVEFLFQTQEVSILGFYQNQDIVFSGLYERNPPHIFINLSSTDGSNRMMMIAKINSLQNDFGDIIKGCLVTVSSYSHQNIASTEFLLAKESYLASHPQAELEIKRYFFLRRTRLLVNEAEKSGELIVHPYAQKPNILQTIVGVYNGVLHLNNLEDYFFTLDIEAYYRAKLILPETLTDYPFQLCYIEMGNRGTLFFLWIKGYVATPGENNTISKAPDIGMPNTMLQVECIGKANTMEGTMSIVTNQGLLSGQVRLEKMPRSTF